MEMGQMVAIGLMGTVLSVLLKKQNPEIALLTSVTTGILIFFMICQPLGNLISLLRETAEKAGIQKGHFIIVLKVLGIAYLAQFGVQLCSDAGETAIGVKLELAGKVLIMAVSAPILLSLLEVVMGLGT